MSDEARNFLKSIRRCPECGSEDYTTQPYDFGMDPETGYLDSGVRAKCSNCSHEADVEDFQPQDGPQHG